MAGKAGADRGANSSDLILGLESLHAIILETRQIVQDVGRRRDGIRTVEQRPARQLRCGYESDGSRFVAGDLPIAAWRDDRLLNGVMSRENFSRLGEVVTGFECDFVGFDQLGVLFELVVNPVQS